MHNLARYHGMYAEAFDFRTHRPARVSKPAERSRALHGAGRPHQSALPFVTAFCHLPTAVPRRQGVTRKFHQPRGTTSLAHLLLHTHETGNGESTANSAARPALLCPSADAALISFQGATQ